MKNRKAQGNNAARMCRQPANRIVSPKIKNIREIRDEKISAPNSPKMSIAIENTTISNPHQDGFGAIACRYCRRPINTYKENKGTAKACEQLGSFHHSLTKRSSTGKYSQMIGSTGAKICHHIRLRLAGTD